MVPIFKSTFSIGKSILTLDDTEKDGGPDSILSICEEHKIKNLILVEDSMTGFVTAHNRCKEREINLIFGIRITCCNDVNEDDNSDHKIVIFANNDDGCRLLYRIYSYAHTQHEGKVDFKFLNSIWNDSVDLVIPFYDSFIYNNNLHLKKCVPDFSKITPVFWLEENVKSILYKNREDVEALQTYKILCNRNFGRAATLSSPNLNHFGSQEFSFESYLDKKGVTNE